MAKNIKCNSCDNPATVHLTQIVNNQIHKVDLCEECAKDKGVADPGGFSISDMFSGTLDSAPGNEKELACPACGSTHADFRRNGRFGCATCYVSFESILEETLEGMHSGIHHCGKMPKLLLGRLENQVKIERIERSLNDAVAAENYEEAARFRDQLSNLRAEAQTRSTLHSNQ